MRIFPHRAFFVVSGLVLVMGVSACGGTTSPSTPTAETAQPDKRVVKDFLANGS